MLMVLGGVFLTVGIGVLLGVRRGARRYYDRLASRTDVREFLERSSDRPGYGAIRLGGLISIIVGAVMLGIGGGMRLWG